MQIHLYHFFQFLTNAPHRVIDWSSDHQLTIVAFALIAVGVYILRGVYRDAVKLNRRYNA